MDSKTTNPINLSPIIELFGTFFEKLTSTHTHKALLLKELAEFKTVLNTTHKDTEHIDHYLNSLSNKSIIPRQSINRMTSNKPTIEIQTRANSTNMNDNSSKMNRPSFTYIKKVEILLISDFLKYRSVGRADKAQILTNRYSHVQSLEKNPNNFYKTIAIYIFTLIIKGLRSERLLSDIVDEVAAKRIELICTTENLTHEDMCGVFCGYISQLIRMKRQRQSIIKILETFYEMVSSEKLFSSAVVSFLKAKVYLFVEQPKFPYELIGLKTQVQSKEFKEKLESNDNSQLDVILRMIPFIFEKDVVVHIFESGKLSEMTYQTSVNKKSSNEDTARDDLNTIYLLIEKVYLTVSVFGLFTTASSPLVEEETESTLKINIAVRSITPSSPGLQSPLSSTTKKFPKVKALALDKLLTSNQYKSEQPSLSSLSNLSANRESLQQSEYKYSSYSTRLSYKPSDVKTPYLNSAKESQKHSYAANNSNATMESDYKYTKPKLSYNTGDSSTASSKYLESYYKRQDQKAELKLSNPQDSASQNNSTSTNAAYDASKYKYTCLTERNYKTDVSPNTTGSYYSRYSYAKATISSTYNTLKDISPTLPVNTERKTYQSRYATPTTTATTNYSNRISTDYKYLNRADSTSYYQRSTSGYNSTNSTYRVPNKVFYLTVCNFELNFSFVL